MVTVQVKQDCIHEFCELSACTQCRNTITNTNKPNIRCTAIKYSSSGNQ